MKNITAKLFNLQSEVGKISKNETNPFFKSKYFDINGLINHLQPLLQKEGLLLLQPIKEGTQFSILIDVESGEQVESGIKLPELNDAQKLGSSITYYRRYSLQSLLGLQAEDDDANKASSKSKLSNDLPWLNIGSVEFDKAIQYMKEGGKVEDIQKKYKLSKEVRGLLCN